MPDNYEIPSLTGDRIALLLSVGGTLLFWFGMVTLVRRDPRLKRNLSVGAAALGAALLAFALGYLGAAPQPVFWLSIIVVVCLGAIYLLSRWILPLLKPAKADQTGTIG